ncbi:MAG: saccharopine dehydrogenase family protein, partial [Candidatus Hodarchaeota archaeon]
MKVLLLGVGLQGKVALHDLVNNDSVTEIIAADINIEALKQLAETNQYSKVQCEFIDANNQENINRLMDLRPDLVIDLLPIPFVNRIAKTAIKYGINLINTLSVSPEIKKLAAEAERKELIVLPEFGLDPGIDLVLLGQAIKGMKEIEVINSYGAGIPTLKAADNPINYKVTWSLEGVLSTYLRKARVIRNGKIVQFEGNELFN